MIVEKNKEYIVDIIDNGYEGEGIAKIDNFTIFIPEAIKGEQIKILIVKIKTNFAFGKVLEIIKKSPYRIEPTCSTYKRCGGCNLRHIDYNETLKIKQAIVQNLVNKTLNTKVEVQSVIGMKNPYNYRNKLQFPLGINDNNKPEIGVFAVRTHKIIPVDECLIQDKESEQIAKEIYKFIIDNKLSVYNEKTGKGIFRHIVIKKGKKTNEIMCILVVNDNFTQEEKLVNYLTNKFENIKTIVKNINNKNTNVILGNTNINLYGSGYIFDKLNEYTFKISPMSFYQTNPIQTEILYNLAIQKASLSKEDIVFDLYCGIGTISIFISKYVNKVYGIEIVPEAIVDANENAKLNNINNCEFISGDVEKILGDLIENNNIPDVIFVDPPRKGLDNTTIENILKIKPKKVIYISCNPASLVRDLAKLENEYYIQKIEPVDMFPFTSHVECVCVLNLKN